MKKYLLGNIVYLWQDNPGQHPGCLHLQDRYRSIHQGYILDGIMSIDNPIIFP
jgi:hypothetical protein